MHHDDRHLVSNMVGSSDMRIEVGSPILLASRDTALLATDGLFDNVHPDEIVEIVRAGPLERAAAALAGLAAKRMTEPTPVPACPSSQIAGAASFSSTSAPAAHCSDCPLTTPQLMPLPK